MKRRKRLPLKKILHNQRGQALLEFILLLVVLSAISFTFVFLMNRNLVRYWEYSANLIIDDKPGTTTVTFDR